MRSTPELPGPVVDTQGDQADLPQQLDENILTLHPRDVPASNSELEQPIWSVICFEGIEAGGLKYGQAVELQRELESHGVTGLCIVTDAAAQRTGPTR